MLRIPLAIALGTAVLLLDACAAWQELTPPSQGSLALDSTRTYGLVLNDGDTLRVRHAGVAGDSVHWAEQLTRGSWIHQSGGRRLADIRRVEAYEGSGIAGHDAEVGLGLLAGFGLVLMIAVISHMSF